MNIAPLIGRLTLNSVMEVIKTQSLTKCFGSFTALNDISLQVNQGDIYGFLGLNGAGKTTLVRAFLRMVHPDSGTIHLFGKKLDYSFGQWNDIGYMVETPYSYPNLTVIENLKIYYHLRALDDKTTVDAIIDKPIKAIASEGVTIFRIVGRKVVITCFIDSQSFIRENCQNFPKVIRKRDYKIAYVY